MNENAAPRLGARLRDARQRQGLTIDQVARSTGLTKGFLSRLERDMTSPSVATLVAVCETLSLPIGSLFTAPDVDLVRRDDAPPIQLTGDGVDERLLTPRGQSHLQLVRSVVEPGAGGGAELYTLNAQVEVLHVLKGALDVEFVDRVIAVHTGDTLTFSGREPHTWRNPSASRRAEAIWVIAPAAWATD